MYRCPEGSLSGKQLTFMTYVRSVMVNVYFRRTFRRRSARMFPPRSAPKSPRSFVMKFLPPNARTFRGVSSARRPRPSVRTVRVWSVSSCPARPATTSKCRVRCAPTSPRNSARTCRGSHASRRHASSVTMFRSRSATSSPRKLSEATLNRSVR